MPPVKRASGTASAAPAAGRSKSAAEPAAKKPAASKRTTAKPAAKKPAASKRTTANKTAAAKRTTAKPAAAKRTTAKPAAARRTTAKPAAKKPAGVAELLANSAIAPRDLLMLTRDRVEEALDEAAARGRVTRKDANDLVADIVRRGRQQTDELIAEIEALLERAREQLEASARRARERAQNSAERAVRAAGGAAGAVDRAVRSDGSAPATRSSAFPIDDYDGLTVPEVRLRLDGLGQPELQKLLAYERKHANRGAVTRAIVRRLP